MEKFDSKQQVFDFIFVMAMRDAVMQKAYNGEKAWLWDLSRPESVYVRNEIWKFIDDQILKGKFDHQEKQEEYDKEFLRLAIDICNKINKAENPKNFTFGNAQKLINMTCKYFYILTYNNENLRKYFACCHCPMDQNLLKKVWEDRSNWIDDIELKAHKKSDFMISWSKLEFKEDEDRKRLPDQYRAFQDAVRKIVDNNDRGIINSIEYDFVSWQSNSEAKSKSGN